MDTKQKLGLCVVLYNNNYGSMLQSYATQQKLEKMKINYDLLTYKKKLSVPFIIKSIPRLLNPIVWSDKRLIIQKKSSLILQKEVKKQVHIRDIYFDDFRKKYFTNISKPYYGYKSLCEGGNEYAAYMVGSDQLWSPSGLPTNFYNLKFAADNKKKISYASSFGVKKIPFYQKKRTQEYLTRFDYISVREQSAKKIICDLIQRDVPVVLDPTLLFRGDEWDELLNLERFINEAYIFAYFLGANPEHRKQARKLSEATGLKIVTLRHLDEFVKTDEQFGDYAPYKVGPEQFVSLIKYAKYVCTDSFHGSVFSVLYKRKFITFNRYDETAKDSKNTRIDSFCSSLGLNERRYGGKNIVNSMEANIDYDNVDVKLAQLRMCSEEYLTAALSDLL